ncbi:MAG: DUF4421 family protein [Bacteroidia bacterium]
MKNLLLFFFLLPVALYANDRHRGSDSLHIYKHIDTTFIEDYRDLFTAKLITVVRTNKFSVKDNASQNSLEYGINTNANFGLGLSLKGIGFEFQWNPPGLNNDDYVYGKSAQLSFATNANGRKFIYDVYYKYNQGYHTTGTYKVPVDTGFVYKHIYRADIKNTDIGGELVYVFNNKRFSSSAPYNLSQKQKKSAGSLLLGTFGSYYSIEADSSIFPDSVKSLFREEIQFKSAGSITWGVSCGYTYTLLFGRKKNWFANVYTLPGLAVQQYYSVSPNGQETHAKTSVGGSLEGRASLGYNRRNYFIGISWTAMTYFVDGNKLAGMSYKNGCFRFYYGHRFDVRRFLKRFS